MSCADWWELEDEGGLVVVLLEEGGDLGIGGTVWELEEIWERCFGAIFRGCDCWKGRWRWVKGELRLSMKDNGNVADFRCQASGMVRYNE